jgi:hypothetical protein
MQMAASRSNGVSETEVVMAVKMSTVVFLVVTPCGLVSGYQPRRTVLGSSPGEDVLCALETNGGIRTRIRQTLFVSARRL